MQVRVVADAFNAAIRCIEPQRIEAGDSGKPTNTRVERSRDEADLGAKRVSHQVDTLRVNHVELRQRVDGGAGIGHHLAHQRPLGISRVEFAGVEHAWPESDLVEREHRESAA